jgi:predicted acyl esterase
MRRLLLLLAVVALALPAEAALAPTAGAAGKAGALTAKKKKKAAKCTKAKRKKKGKKADAAAKKKSKKKATCKKKKKKKKARSLAPIDYSQIKGLSQPTYTDIETQEMRLPMSDGTEIYLEITKPKAPGHYGVIVEASVYHGTVYDRTGTRILPGPTKGDTQLGLKGFFPPRGYAVVMMDLRGTGRSQGCLDHIGPKDMSDIKQVIEWATSQPWSNGRAGILGHSYVGTTPIAATAVHPKGLVTAVASAGVGISMYEHQFQAGVPYNLQWAGPIEAYEELAIDRYIPGQLSPVTASALGGGQAGDNFGNDMQYFGCGLTQAAVVKGEPVLSGQYTTWDRERDYTAATKTDIPVFVIHGENDQAARVISTDWFTLRGGKPGDKFWLGQWDHGIGCCPNRRGAQWTYAILAWFDKQILQRNVDTGPPVEIFLNDGKTVPEAIEGRKEIYTAPTWPLPPRTLSLHPSSDGGLGMSAAAAGSNSFAGDPLGYNSADATASVSFATPPATEDRLLIGIPELQLAASVTVPRVYLIGTLYDDSPDGSRRRLSQCAMNPELREGIDKITPVTPGAQMKLKPPCFPMSQHWRKGHKLVLRITTSDPDKVPFFAIDPNITIFSGPDASVLKLPLIESPKLYDDKFKLKIAGYGG